MGPRQHRPTRNETVLARDLDYCIDYQSLDDGDVSGQLSVSGRGTDNRIVFKHRQDHVDSTAQLRR